MATAAVTKGWAVEEERVADAMVRTPGGAHDRRVRRRGNREQGHALELLGHAVEYLVDSRLFTGRIAEAGAEQEAVQILMRASRAVFSECQEVISPGRRMKRMFWGATVRMGLERRRS